MKRTFLYILAALLAASCKNSSVQNNKSEGDKPVITVTIEPLRYFTEAIAGDEFTVVSMVPKGSSPETYDPTPPATRRSCQEQSLLPDRLHRF